MSRYLDPKNDVVFKKIFGEHPLVLKSFLNALLPLDSDGQIVSLEYLTPEQAPQIPALKRTIVDVKCTDQQGRHFIVEMQMQWTDSFKQRMLFNASQAYVKQLEAGEHYHLLQPVYGLALIASIFDPDSPGWYHHYQLVNVQKPRQEIIDGLQLIFIELPKFNLFMDDSHPLRTLWLRFMDEIGQKTREVPPELLNVPEIQQAVQLAESSAYSKGELLAYESYWDSVSTEKTLLYDAFQAGKKETKQEVALALLKRGVELEIIMVTTGLSVETIQQLRDH